MELRVALNLEEKKIGCPIIQALYGGYLGRIANCVDTEHWELNPGPCRLYIITEEQLLKFIRSLGGCESMAQDMINQFKIATK